MAKYSNTVEYNIKTTLDMTGISKLRAELQQLSNFVSKRGNQKLLGDINAPAILKDIKSIENAINKAFNPKLGMLNASQFNRALTASGLNAQTLYNKLSSLGPVGQRTFNSLAAQMGKIDIGMRNVSSTTDKIMNTLGNTVRWGLIASGFSQVMNAAHQATQYVKDLDKSLTNIMMVSGETRDNMNEFAKSANEVAQRLGATTVQMTDAAKVFVQQGMTLNQSQQMGEYAVHLANISEQDSTTTSDELTAMKNAFKINIDDMGNAISKWAAIANNTAVDMEELSVASQKAASVANTVGVDMEQFAGHIAAIEATTREAPENIGNGLKTLYSRFADIKLGETLEDGVDLGQFSSALEKVGVSVLDAEGKMRDVGAIMEDMMAKWQDLDKTERNAVATTVAGRFQLARFEALMNSQDIYRNAVNVARNEQGTETYDRMQEIYRDSLEGRSKALQSKVEELFLNIFNSDSFNGAIDALSGFVDILNDLIESVGGGTAALTALSAILLKISNTAISRGISNFISNRQADRRANENIKFAEDQAKRTAGMYGISGSTQEQQSFIDSMAAVSRNSSLMTAEEIRLYNQGIEEQAGLLNEASAAQETYKSNIEAIRGALESQNLITKDSDAAVLGYVETMELMGNTLTIDNAKYKEAQEGLVKLGQEFAKYHAQAQQIINTNEQITLTEEQITNVSTINAEAFKTLKTTLSEWIASGRFATTTTGHLEDILTTLNTALEAQSRIVEGNEQSIRDATTAWREYLKLAPRLETIIGNVSSSMAVLNKDIQKNAASARNASTAYITANSQAGAIQGSRERTAEQLKTRKITEDIVNLGQAATTAVFAFQSLSGIFSTLSDDSLTLAEKVEHIALNLGMVAAMGIPAITQVKEAFNGLSNQIKIAGQNWSVLLEQKDALSAFNIYKDMGQVSIPYITNINTGQIARPVEVVNAIEAEINSGKILNETLIKEIALKNNCSAADVKRVAQAMNLATAEELVANNIKGKNIAEQLNLKIMNSKHAVYLKSVGAVLLYESGLTQLTAAELMATEGAIGLMVALTPIIAAAAGLIAIVSIVNSISEAEEKRKERLQATIDANNEAVTAIKENREELQSLYAEYQETGEASDEFKQKLQEQADALGVVGANIDILLGRYDALIEKLDTASNSQLNYNNILLDKQNQDLYTENAFISPFDYIQGVSKFGLSSLGTSFRPGGESLRLTGAQTYSQELQLDKIVDLQNDAAQKQKLAETQLSELLGSEPIDKMSKEWEEWNEQVKSLNEELWKLDLILDDINKQSDLYTSNVLDEANSQAKENWITQIDNEWLQQFTDKNSWLNQNSVASINELNDAIVEGKLGKHIQEYFDVLNEIDPAQAKAKLIEYAQQIVDSDVENQFTDSGLKLQGALIAGLTDDDGNFNTELYDKVAQKFSFFNDEQIEKFANYLNRDWENEDLTQFLENFVTATSVDTSSISNLILLIGQINPSNWTNLFSLLGNVFQNGNSIADFFEQFANWDITEKARALGDFNLTTEKLNAVLERLNISQEELDQYQKDLINTTPKLKKRFNDLTAEYEKYVKEHKENTAEGKRAKQALDSFNASMQDMTATLLKQKQGLSDFTEQWEDISEKISDTDPAIRLEGINELRPILEDITNLDLSGVNADLLVTEENLNLMAEAANGDGEAMQNLIRNLDESYLVSIGITEDGQNLPAEMQIILDQVQAAVNNTELEVGATINNEPFIEGLRQMLQSTQYTAEQIDAFFTAVQNLGIEFDLDLTNIVSALSELEKKAASLNTNTIEGAITSGAFSAISTGLWAEAKGHLTATKTGDISGLGNSLNKGGSGGSGGSGGGGGGSGKTDAKSVSAEKSEKAEFDIYNKVDDQLDKLGKKYDAITNKKSRMYGSNLRKAAAEEIKNLTQQNDKLKERNKITEAYIKSMQTGKNNDQYGIDVSDGNLKTYGLEVDSEGTITNYKQIYTKLESDRAAKQKAADDYFKAHGGTFNADGSTKDQATMTEAEEAHYKTLTQAAADAADKVKGLEGVVNNYQDATDKLADDTEQIAENIRKIEDAQIDLFQIASKTVDTFKELKENANWLEGYYSGLKSDSPFRALGEDLANLGDLIDSTTDKGEHFFNEMISKAQEAGDKAAIDFWTDAKNEAKKQIGDGTSILDMRQFYLQKLLSPEGRNLYGSNEKQWYEDLKEAYDNIIGDLKDIESKYESTLKDILDCYDDIADRMEFRNDQLEYQLDLLDAQRDLTETLHGEDSYGAFLILDAANVAGTLQQVKQIRGEYDYWVKRRDQYDKETQKDLWEAMDEQVRNFGEKLSDATQDAADAMAQQYEDATEKIVQDFRNKLFGKDSLGQADLFESEWEMAKDKADQYLDSVERSYELEKLRAKYQKMLDNTNDLGVQNKIKAAMDEQLKALENQKKAIINNQGELEYVNALSQFDVDLANAKVEALQKQIALEEAQRNKNQMQLRRDTQGNYRYVYRANEEDLAQAQEELTDSDYEIYEMSKERYSDVLNERWALQQEYEEKVRQANERYRNDEEAHKRALAEINDWYVERQVNLGLELQDAQAGMIEGVQHLAEDTTDYVSQTFEDISAAMLDNWTDTLGDIGVATSGTLQDLTLDVEDFRDNVDEVWDLAVEAVQTFSNEVGELETSAGAAFTNVDTCVENVTSSLDDAAQSAKEFMDIINADTGGIDDAVIRLQSYEREISQTKDSASALATALKQAQDNLETKTREAAVYKTIIEQAKAGTHDLNGNKIQKSKGSSGNNGGGRNPSQYEKEGIAAAIWNGNYGWGAGDERRRRLEEKGFSYSEIQSIVNIGYERANAWIYANGWPSNYAYWSYDTGGYTGDWGNSEGRIAMLHQKELVLNSSDTENMLVAVKVVREMVNTLKNIGAFSSISSLGNYATNTGNDIQQRVEITAEFPNVDTADDIREALLSLADNAYQYVYSTR